MRASKKDKILFLLIGIIVLMGVGYAYLNTNLSISGIAGIGTPTWDVHFENVVVKNGSVETVTKAPTIDGSKTSIDYEITLNEPGEYYEFTVDVKNGGTIDAMIDSISTTVNGNSISSIPNYLEYSITYEDGVEIAKNHLLEAGNSVKYKIKVNYKTDISASDLPSTDQTLRIVSNVNYIQANNDKMVVPTLELGKYIYLKPDAVTYTITTAQTGYPYSQTISPEQLTLWRIINKNANGTYDAVSEYTSSTGIKFKGTVGYANFVNTLQEISTKYANSKYTVSTRAFGYDGQTLTISNTSAFDGSTNMPSFINELPISSSAGRYYFYTPNLTTGTGQEYFGGNAGDTLYLKDYLLVKNVYGDVDAVKVGSTTKADYWIASRRFEYYNDGEVDLEFNGRTIRTSGGLDAEHFRIYGNNSGWVDNTTQENGDAFRPIITIKAIVNISNGTGTLEDPYILS